MGQALSRAEGAQQAAAASLFAGWQEKLIASALEGAMGGVWMLEDTPGGALAECGDFLFLEARDSQTARNLLMAWKREHAGRYAILVARDPALSALVPEVFAGDAALTRRYAFHKGGEAFDRERLARFAACAPADVELRPFDREACRLAMQAPWSRSFCEQFRDEDDFLARGLGVAALRDGELRRGVVLRVLQRRHRAAGGNPQGHAQARRGAGLLRSADPDLPGPWPLSQLGRGQSGIGCTGPAAGLPPCRTL